VPEELIVTERIDEGTEEHPRALERGPPLPPKVGDPLVFLRTFREYAKGQPPMSEGRGVITFGEVTETGSSRIFAFPPEEYGEIYDKLAEKRTLAEGQIRRMMTFGTPVLPVEAAAGD